MKKIVIKGELTDLNAYVKSLNSNRFSGNNVKQDETSRVWGDAIEQKVKPVKEYPVHIVFTWYSKNLKMDIDNICFAKKFILDGLVLARVLENDSRKFLKSFQDVFHIDKNNPRVEVEIYGPNE